MADGGRGSRSSPLDPARSRWTGGNGGSNGLGGSRKKGNGKGSPTSTYEQLLASYGLAPPPSLARDPRGNARGTSRPRNVVDKGATTKDATALAQAAYTHGKGKGKGNGHGGASRSTDSGATGWTCVLCYNYNIARHRWCNRPDCGMPRAPLLPPPAAKGGGRGGGNSPEDTRATSRSWNTLEGKQKRPTDGSVRPPKAATSSTGHGQVLDRGPRRQLGSP
jgi:hypothetical protein